MSRICRRSQQQVVKAKNLNDTHFFLPLLPFFTIFFWVITQTRCPGTGHFFLQFLKSLCLQETLAVAEVRLEAGDMRMLPGPRTLVALESQLQVFLDLPGG